MTARALRASLLLAGALLGAACHRAGAPPPQRVHEARRVEFDPADANRLLVVERGGGIGLWRVDDPEHPVGEHQLAAAAVDARFLPAGQGLVSSGPDGRVRRWGLDGSASWTSDATNAAAIRALAVAPDRIAAAGEDGAVRLWTFAGQPAGTLTTDAAILLAVAFSPRGDWLAAEGSDTQLRLWRREPGGDAFSPVATFRPVDPRYAALLPNLLRFDVGWGWDRSLAFAPDGLSLAAADFAGNVQRWSLAGEPLGEALPSAGRQHIRAVAVAPDGRLAAAIYDGTFQLWPAAGAHPLVVKAHDGVTTGIAFAPDGQRLATTSLDGSVRLWSADGTWLGALPSME